MTITYYPELEQGSTEWFQCRTGLITASEMKKIVTPSLKIADNKDTRTHMYELLAQRINNYVEPQFVGDDQIRGHEDEVTARILYSEYYDPVEDMGFITNDKWGFKLGFSPDGMIGKKKAIECKSRRQKYQTQTLIEGTVPEEYVMQVQTGMMVGELECIDYVSFSAGMPMYTFPVYPDEKIQSAIVTACTAFEEKMTELMQKYKDKIASGARLIPTERKIEEEIVI